MRARKHAETPHEHAWSSHEASLRTLRYKSKDTRDVLRNLRFTGREYRQDSPIKMDMRGFEVFTTNANPPPDDGDSGRCLPAQETNRGVSKAYLHIKILRADYEARMIHSINIEN